MQLESLRAEISSHPELVLMAQEHGTGQFGIVRADVGQIFFILFSSDSTFGFPRLLYS